MQTKAPGEKNARRGYQTKPITRDRNPYLSPCPEGKAGRIELVHVNVADHDFQGVTEG
jgi:hypothetical protein